MSRIIFGPTIPTLTIPDADTDEHAVALLVKAAQRLNAVSYWRVRVFKHAFLEYLKDDRRGRLLAPSDVSEQGGYLIPNDPIRVELRGWRRLWAILTGKPTYIEKPGLADQLMERSRKSKGLEAQI